MTTRDKYTDVPVPYSWEVPSVGDARFTWEYDVHLHLKRARSMESFLGTPVWHRERVAHHPEGIVREVELAIADNAVVVVGMAQNPFPRLARRAP